MAAVGEGRETLTFRLPWPPSANHYKGERVFLPPAGQIKAAFTWGDGRGHAWLRKNVRVDKYLKAEAKDFYSEVRSVVGVLTPLDGPCRIDMQLYPPDRRRRDADNVFKCVFDALERCHVVENDWQFRSGSWVMHPPVAGGAVEVAVSRIGSRQETLQL